MGEMSKTKDKWQVQCSDLQKALNEESFLKDEAIEKCHQIEQKVLVLKSEIDDYELKFTESERKRKIREEEFNEMNESLDNLKSNYDYLLSCKIKLEKDQNQLSVEMEDKNTMLRAAEERQVKLKQHISRLEENLIEQQEKCFEETNQRKQAESRMREEITRAENSEMKLAQGGAQVVKQLESKIFDLEEELEIERR